METISKFKSNWQKSLDDVIQEMVAYVISQNHCSNNIFLHLCEEPFKVLDEKLR